jgi:hypothetical protein
MPKSPSKWKNTKEIKLKFDEVTSKNEDYINDVLTEIETTFYSLLREGIPYYTGKYYESFHTVKKDNRRLVIATSNELLYIIFEFTGITVPFIKTKNAKALHWIDPFTGEDVFVKYYAVDSPLQKHPRPHVRPVVEAIRRGWVDIAYGVAQKHFRFLQGHLNTQSFQELHE